MSRPIESIQEQRRAEAKEAKHQSENSTKDSPKEWKGKIVTISHRSYNLLILFYRRGKPLIRLHAAVLRGSIRSRFR
jgi:hypothetical protein